MSAPAQANTSTWYGPASVVGAMLGVLFWALPYAVSTGSGLLWLWLVPPLLGCALLAVRGAGRQVGVGLLASCLTLPIGILAFAVVGFTL